MTRITRILPVLAGAVAGAIVALLIAHGGGGSTKTVVDEARAPGSSTQNTSSGGQAASTIPVSNSSSGGLTVNQIYKKDSPGVVDIDTTSVQSGSPNGIFSSPSQTQYGEGAGVVYDMSGDILTDEHVVAGATSVKVHFQDGVTATARVLGADPSTDVAVIRVNVRPAELHPIKFANSNDAQVGDPVVAIGSPFGLPETTTSGIVSAVGRPITAPNNYTIPGAIQTDAAINPGNSGGPLLDAAGDVIGLNDQIQTSSGDSSGVGFATPANADVQVARTIIAGNKVEHPYVGVCLVDSSSGGAEIASSGGGSCSSSAVVAGSPAAKAGLRAGDTITKVNGRAITGADGFISSISTFKPGDTVTLTVRQPGGQRKQIQVTLGARPATAPTAG
jgi:putative serine protease PepD